MKSYRFVVLSMGNNGVLACPAVGADLQQALARLLCRFDELFLPGWCRKPGARSTINWICGADAPPNISKQRRELQAVADLEDLGQIRASLVRQATEPELCVDQMAEDNGRAITELKTEMSVCEIRLRETETLASKDELTGLLNRRSLENRIEIAIASVHTFCLVLFDLNGFKQINDSHGHADC
ncbi:MAG TPA: diguanylate cyclase [Candidatus Aquilonibacter sp.]|nr:diguanylate cyclase [Candidatus Aquilonibacter sp.]